MALDACGFEHDEVDPTEAASIINREVERIVALLTEQGDLATRRPHDDRWSSLEYAAHVRDVLLTCRDRIIAGAVADSAQGQPIYRDERVRYGFYANDTLATIEHELRAAEAMTSRVIQSLQHADYDRMMQYSNVSAFDVSLRWIAAQCAHEAYHHRLDVEENGVRAD